MYGYIEKGNSTVSFYITVCGYPHRGYNGYTLEEAKERYTGNFNPFGQRQKPTGSTYTT